MAESLKLRHFISDFGFQINHTEFGLPDPGHGCVANRQYKYVDFPSDKVTHYTHHITKNPPTLYPTITSIYLIFDLGQLSRCP
jgi:hypothetical protein